ncbi:MAG: sigma factor [Planctomycetota bacterium]
MADADPDRTPTTFPVTSWGLIRAGQATETLAYRQGLEGLFRTYWGPVHNYIRRCWGADAVEADDLTQEYFLAFLEGDLLKGVSAEKGRFRAWVRVTLKHFLLDRKRNARALKRSPGGRILSMEALRKDGSFPDVPDPAGKDPDELLDADWRCAAIWAALRRLEAEARDEGREWAYACFVTRDIRPPEGGPPNREELARQAGKAVHDVANALHWARQRYKALLIEEVRDSVVDPSDLDTEMRELFGL